MRKSRATYDCYRGVRRLENCARALLDALSVVESTQSMTIQSAQNCPRCKNMLKEIRIEPRFVRLFIFCPECHFFLLFDRIGRIKTFADYSDDARPLNLPPRPSPLRPLERSIFNHLQSIKKDTRL